MLAVRRTGERVGDSPPVDAGVVGVGGGGGGGGGGAMTTTTGGESPTRSPVRRTASKFSWAEDDEVSLFQFSYGQFD